MSPYSLTESLSEFTANTADTDTAALNQSLDTLSDTIDRITPQLGPDLRRREQAVADDSTSATSRWRICSRARPDVTGILSERSQQVNTLLLNANDLLGVLQDRRYAIVNLLANTSALSQQLSGLVADNEKELAPALEKLNSVTCDAAEEQRQHRQGAQRVGEVSS